MNAPPTSPLLIGGAALNQIPIDWENNLQNIREAITRARMREVRVLCLPELCVTGYGCEDLFLSEWVPAQAVKALFELLPDCHDITVAVGLPVRFEGSTYDCAALVRDGVLLGIAAKQHLANDGVHYESRWFTPWPAGREAVIRLHGTDYPFGDLIFETPEATIAFEICEDAWREELRPGYRHCQRGVNLILNPSASHFAFGKKATRRRLILEGSQAFGCAYVYANLLGNEAGKMIYDGDIMIAQRGRMLQQDVRFTFQDINLIAVPVSLAQPSTVPVPTLTEDPEDKETEFTAAVTLGLFDYMRKSRSRGFVLSLSGGADSSTLAVLVAEMVRRGVGQLGLDRFAHKAGFLSDEDQQAAQVLPLSEQIRFLTARVLRCAYQGTVNSSDDTFASAQALAHDVGARFHDWRIDAEVNGYQQKIEGALQRPLTWDTDDIALQNIQSRVRAPAIWMLTNTTGALLLTTSNRSEGSVGYATMDGDTSGGLAPIAGVDKSFIRHWLQWAEHHLCRSSLRHVNRLQPSAELRPLERVQTDEDDLMPYDVLQAIERLAIFERQPPQAVYHHLLARRTAPAPHLKKYVTRFFRLWAQNQWKRERIAPSFHLDDYSVDPRSWCRFPILSGGFRTELAELAQL